MYPKGANLLHSIRHAMNDDEKFRQMLRGLGSTFYHQTVTSRRSKILSATGRASISVRYSTSI